VWQLNILHYCKCHSIVRIIVVVFLSVLKQLPVFRGPIYKIYYLTIMPKLRSTCDGRLICKTSYKERKAFLRYDLGTTHLQSCKIVFPRESAYDIPERNLCTSFVTVVSRSYDKLMINRKIFCKSGPTILWATCTLTDSQCCSIDLSANVVYSLPS